MNDLEKKLDTCKIEKSDFLLLRTVMNMLPNPMSIKNHHLERIAVNQAFVDISGYSEDRLLKDPTLDIQDRRTKTSIDYDKKVLSTKECSKHIEKIRNAEGEGRWLEIQKSYFQSEAGDEHVISVLTDITQLIQREFKLEASLVRANQKVLQRSRFLANMGHDIRTPLNSVVGMTSVLKNSDLDHKQMQAVDVLGRGGNALMRIIEDIIDFAKFDAGVMKIEQSIFELRELVEDLAAELGTTARDNEIDLIVSIDPNLPETFIGDPERIRQILMNLVENAIKFTSQGYVSVVVSGTSRNNIVDLKFVIKDTGTGIPPGKLKSLFVFLENDEKAERISGISGLGISLCQKFANLMRGRIHAESIEGIGSVFQLLLPLVAVSKTETKQSFHTLLHNTHKPMDKILFVDDIKENYDAALPYLSARGLIADYAQSAAHAVQLLNNVVLGGAPYTVIFIDYLMPVTDGLLLTGSLRNNQKYSNIKLVTLSSVNDSEIRECFVSQNVTEYLTKPIRKSDLDALFKNTSHLNFHQAV